MSEKKYPVGIRDFGKLRSEGYFYVDKTAQIYKMINAGSHYFLHRPRRFGKSLLVSMLEAFFLGKKELFEGLAIETLEKEWTVRPVLHLDLSVQKYDTQDSLENQLNGTLAEWEKRYGTETVEKALPMRFAGIIEQACLKEGQRVVILVDGYDKPVLDAMGNETLCESFRNMLEAFYCVTKNADEHIEFTLLVGTSRMGDSGAFSGLDNMIDISMQTEYADICGISEQELRDNFTSEINKLATAREITPAEAYAELRKHYGGYHFGHDALEVYNPFSLFNALKSKAFGNYRLITDASAYLTELLKKSSYDLDEILNIGVPESVLMGIHASSDNPVSVFYQTGYLTIRDYDPSLKLCTLGFPDCEVEQGFMNFLLSFHTRFNKTEAAFEIQKCVHEVRMGQPNAFFHRLQSFFAGTPHGLACASELHCRNMLFVVFRLMSFSIEVEYHSSKECIDLILQTDSYIYIMKFMPEGTAEEVVAQMNEEKHALSFATNQRRVFKIGVNFNNKTRNIERWIVE